MSDLNLTRPDEKTQRVYREHGVKLARHMEMQGGVMLHFLNGIRSTGEARVQWKRPWPAWWIGAGFAVGIFFGVLMGFAFVGLSGAQH